MKDGLTQSLANGLRILLISNPSSPFITVQQITKELGYSQAKTYRLLRTLIQLGFLHRVPRTSQYTLGLQVLRLGLIAQDTVRLSEIALPVMRELSNLTKESVFLTVVDGTQGLCIAKVDSDGPIHLSLKPGTRLPFHSGASTKILMAYLSEGEWNNIIKKEGLKRFTARTITDPTRLKTHLIQIRKRGYAISDQEVDVGVRAVAAPIFDARGILVGGLSIAGPIHRFNKKRFRILSKFVVKYSKKISGLLGFV